MISRQSLEILIDLIEIKLSAIIIQDKDDIREVRKLKNCKNELIKAFKTSTPIITAANEIDIFSSL